ncbi:MAG: hypothetical protein ACI35Z_00085 [Sphingobacterium hotanense]
MNKLKMALIAGAIGFASPVFSQDLINKVPGESNFVLAINGKAFFKHVDAEQVNRILSRTGFFNNVMGKNNPLRTKDIQEMGIDIRANAYINSITTDSVQYLGALFPLSDKAKFEALLPKEKEIVQVNGLPTIYSSDKTLRISWDNNTIYILGGLAMDNYFKRDDIKQRYGFLEHEGDPIAEEFGIPGPPVIPADTTVVEWEAWEEEEEEAAVEAVAEAAEEAAKAAEEAGEGIEVEMTVVPPPAGIPPATIETEEDEYAYVDSVLERDEYQDDYYLEYRKIENHNDSIKNVLVSGWVDLKINDIISGKVERHTSKNLRNIKDNELIRFEMDHIADFYKYYYPTDILYSTLGMRPTFDYGYKSVSGAAVIEGNKLSFKGDLAFDKTMAKYYKEIYQNKFNPKFYKYLDKNALGFLTLNLNTEAYLKHLPKIVTRVFGEDNDNRYSEIVDVFATSFEILLDEKAIAKVFKGDNLIVLNGVTNKEITYTDYEYDEDYNYTEVERTKTEAVPDFLWMFSSDDVSIFEKIVKIGLREEGLIDHDGIYEFKVSSRETIKPYLLIDKGIVFMGNDLTKLQAIKDGSFRATGDRNFINLVKKNPVVALFNTPKLPAMLTDLDIPVHRSMQKSVDELSKYGNIYMVGSKVKGNSMQGELSIEFPEGQKNALSFLVNLIENWTLDLED